MLHLPTGNLEIETTKGLLIKKKGNYVYYQIPFPTTSKSYNNNKKRLILFLKITKDSRQRHKARVWVFMQRFWLELNSIITYFFMFLLSFVCLFIYFFYVFNALRHCICVSVGGYSLSWNIFTLFRNHFQNNLNIKYFLMMAKVSFYYGEEKQKEKSNYNEQAGGNSRQMRAQGEFIKSTVCVCVTLCGFP